MVIKSSSRWVQLAYFVAACCIVLAGLVAAVWFKDRSAVNSTVVDPTTQQSADTDVEPRSAQVTNAGPTDQFVVNLLGEAGDGRTVVVDSRDGSIVRTLYTVSGQDLVEMCLVYDAQIGRDGTVYGVIENHDAESWSAAGDYSCDSESGLFNYAFVAINPDGSRRTLVEDATSFSLLPGQNRAVVVVTENVDKPLGTFRQSLEIVDLATGARQAVRKDARPMAYRSEIVDATTDGQSVLIASDSAQGYVSGLVDLSERDDVVEDDGTDRLFRPGDETFLSTSLPEAVGARTREDGQVVIVRTPQPSSQSILSSDWLYVELAPLHGPRELPLEDVMSGPAEIRKLAFADAVELSSDGRGLLLGEIFSSSAGGAYVYQNPLGLIVDGETRTVRVPIDSRVAIVDFFW